MDRSRHRLDTLAIHGGEPEPRIDGAAVPPIYQSSVFEQGDAQDYDTLRYPRLNNLPNHHIVGAKIAALEGGEDAVPTASGMAAITTALLEVSRGGGHVLVQNTLYGGTHAFVHQDLPELGIHVDVFDPREDPAEWKKLLRRNTRAIYAESITNPLVQVADHAAIVAFAREHELTAMIDSTFATPVNFRPLELGYDVVLHSCTKYLNGHSDLVAGCAVGSAERMLGFRRYLNHLGGSLDPHALFLLHRGLRTLPLRVRRQNENALELARWLEQHAGITTVHYPGLPSHRDHERAGTLFRGFGGMLAFEAAGDGAAVDAMLGKLELPVWGPSLGGLETLVTRPATTSHASLTAQERTALGIHDNLVRVSVGIEDPADLIADFEQALQAAAIGAPA